MARNVSTAIANPIRTGVQLVPSAVITEFIDAFVYDMSEKQYLALAALLLLLVSFVQNTIENHQERGFLRKIPPTDVPIIDDRPGDADVPDNDAQ